MKFRSDDGFLIRVGRNNRQNDQLTLKQSDGRDLWFHVKTIPGSHVVIRTEGQPVPDTTMTQAAILAATYSKGADSTGVAVDYCPVKRVKKAPGSPPGMVIYENYNTAYVNPDPGLAEKLKIFEHSPPGFTAFLNGDDPLLCAYDFGRQKITLKSICVTYDMKSAGSL